MLNQEQTIAQLQDHLVSVLELKLELAQKLEEMLRAVVILENDTSSQFNWSYLLKDLHTALYDVDLNASFRFVDDVEEQINDIPFKIRRVTQSMRTAVNPILRNTPVFFDASNPPTEQDFASDNDAKGKK